jgi:L-malate glycosyltransferase
MMIAMSPAQAAPLESPALYKHAAAACTCLQAERSILFLVDQLTELGGGERVLFDLVRELPHYGFRIAVITFRGKVDPAAFALCDNLRVLPLSSCFSLSALRVAAALRTLIRRERVDIVHTFFESADTYGALVARLSGVPCLVSSRRDMGILRSTKHHLAYRLLARTYDAVLAVSEQVRRWHLETDRLREEQIRTIHNGLAIDRFRTAIDPNAARRALGLPVDKPLVTTVTNINMWKGVDVFLRAVALVHRTHPDAVFAIAGDWTDAALVAELQDLAHSLGIAECTYFLGRVADVPSLLLASNVFALLSRTEGFPNVVLQAMAASLPVVATAVGGTPEAIDDGVTGFLVCNQDARAAATHITTLLCDEDLRQRIGAAGRRRVEQDFSLQEMVRKHVALYDALLQSRTLRRP